MDDTIARGGETTKIQLFTKTSHAHTEREG